MKRRTRLTLDQIRRRPFMRKHLNGCMVRIWRGDVRGWIADSLQPHLYTRDDNAAGIFKFCVALRAAKQWNPYYGWEFEKAE